MISLEIFYETFYDIIISVNYLITLSYYNCKNILSNYKRDSSLILPRRDGIFVVELGVEEILLLLSVEGCSITELEVSPSTLLVSPSRIDASLGYSKVRVAVSSNCIRC